MSITTKYTFTAGLTAIVGKKKGTRAEATKAIWAYADENGLKIGGGKFKADKKLKAIGAKATMDIGSVARLISENIVD